MAAFFGNLPVEIRAMIWGMAASNDFEGRVIECVWNGEAYYQRATRRIDTLRRPERAGIRWNYSLEEASMPLGTLTANRESHAITMVHNPHYLQLNRGPRIYFNGARDIIYFDMLDTFHMFNYSDRLTRSIGRLNVHGFDEIRQLARPRIHNYRGLQDLMTSPLNGFMMPNVETVEYLHRPLRVTNFQDVDRRLHDAYADVRSRLMLESQRMRTFEDEVTMSLQTSYVFLTIAE